MPCKLFAFNKQAVTACAAASDGHFEHAVRVCPSARVTARDLENAFSCDISVKFRARLLIRV